LKLSPNQIVRFESAIWYWHFVDVVWLFLYLSIYWWRIFSFSI
jgi:cytochrome c oxidase subunit 3